jgi:asparagine synthase (glutamine-hydrolysing)
VRQLLEHPGVSRELDESAMADYLVNHFDGLERTMFRSVLAVPPAHRIVAGPDGLRTERYWDVDPSHRTVLRDDREYADGFLDLFRRSVSDRLRSTSGTVGVLMSGGLDSCSVAAMGQELTGKPGYPDSLLACSFAFEELQECDEREYSDVMTEVLDLEIDYVDAESLWLLGDATAFAPRLDTPFLNWESLGHEVHRRLGERGARVMLTGHGGDNLTQGSALVYADALRRWRPTVLVDMMRHARAENRPFWNLLRRFVLRPLIPARMLRLWRGLPGRGADALLPSWLDRAFVRRTRLAERLLQPSVEQRFRGLARQKIYEITADLGALLRTVHWHDWVAAHYGQEARHPFLDRRLVEYVVSIPPEQHFHAGRRKLLLRRALAGILPERIRRRRDKTVFTRYFDLALRDKEVALVRGLFRDPVLGQMGIVDGERLRTAYERFLEEGDPSADRGPWWFVISLERWLRQHQGLPNNTKTSYH